MISTWTLILFLHNGGQGVGSGQMTANIPGFASQKTCLAQAENFYKRRYGSVPTYHNFLYVEVN